MLCTMLEECSGIFVINFKCCLLGDIFFKKLIVWTFIFFKHLHIHSPSNLKSAISESSDHFLSLKLFFTCKQVCQEHYEKVCNIAFNKQATNQTLLKCYKPMKKTCEGLGPVECRTVFESSCTTKYIEKRPGKFVGDTACQKLPVEICGAGCTVSEGEEECHNKTTTSLVDVPEETCDLVPQKSCKGVYKLVKK